MGCYHVPNELFGEGDFVKEDIRVIVIPIEAFLITAHAMQHAVQIAISRQNHKCRVGASWPSRLRDPPDGGFHNEMGLVWHQVALHPGWGDACFCGAGLSK